MFKECNCGSGLERFEIKDAAGIFCCFVCDKCEAEKVAKFNPKIFEAGPYAATGDEQDLWIDTEEGDDY